MTVASASLALALLASIACGTPDVAEQPDAAAPQLEAELVIGSAEISGVGFIAVTDGAEVELVGGAQGGFHLWTTLRTTGVAGVLTLQREARRVDDGTLILRAQPMRLEVPELAMEQWWQRDEASPSFMCPSPVGVTVFDVEIELTAQLADEDGLVVARDRVVLVPRCPIGDQHAWCLEICAG
jgi:hypothetical protein